MKLRKNRKAKSRKSKPRMGRPPGQTYPGRVGPFNVGAEHEKLFEQWAKDDGITGAALMRELINREHLRRLGHTSVMVNNTRAAEATQAKQLV